MSENFSWNDFVLFYYPDVSSTKFQLFQDDIFWPKTLYLTACQKKMRKFCVLLSFGGKGPFLQNLLFLGCQYAPERSLFAGRGQVCSFGDYLPPILGGMKFIDNKAMQLVY